MAKKGVTNGASDQQGVTSTAAAPDDAAEAASNTGETGATETALAEAGAATAEDASAGAAGTGSGEAGPAETALAEDGTAVRTDDDLEPQPAAAPNDAGDAGGGAGDASETPEPYQPDPHPISGPARLFLTLGVDAPDPDIGLTEIPATSVVPARRETGTVTLAVDLIAEPELLKREVSTVFLVALVGEPAETIILAASQLVTPVSFGAGNGLHLPSRSLVLTGGPDAS